MDKLKISRASLRDQAGSDLVKAERESDNKDIFNCLILWQ